jgi:hypothetical protein
MKNKFRDHTCQIAYDADSYIITIEKTHHNILLKYLPIIKSSD